MEEIIEFINACKVHLVDQLKQQEVEKREHRKRRNAEKAFKRAKKKYLSSEKGLYAISKRNYNRRVKYKISCEGLDWEEKKLIGRFYKNCPEGYEVDHIFPVSKGGLHRLSNLQYLTKEENRRKSASIYFNR